MGESYRSAQQQTHYHIIMKVNLCHTYKHLLTKFLLSKNHNTNFLAGLRSLSSVGLWVFQTLFAWQVTRDKLQFSWSVCWRPPPCQHQTGRIFQSSYGSSVLAEEISSVAKACRPHWIVSNSRKASECISKIHWANPCIVNVFDFTRGSPFFYSSLLVTRPLF